LLAFVSKYYIVPIENLNLMLRFLFLGHDSTVTIVYPGPSPTLINIKINSLPYVTLIWVSEESLVTAGHDCQPVLFSCSGDNQWKHIGSLDDSASGTRSAIAGMGNTRGGGASGIGRLNNEAFNRFKNADARGSSSPSSATTPQALQAQLTGNSSSGAGGGATELMTVHQNTITSIRPYEWGSNGEVTRASTTGVDGRLVVWNVDYAAAAANGAQAGSLSARMGGMRLK